MASSLAFWFETKNDNDDIDLNNIDTELHFNYWSLKSINTNYLDIGVHISSECHDLSKSLRSIKIYLPFEKKDIEFDLDLGALVCDDKALLAAIFNSHILSTRSEDSSGVLNITLPDGKDFDFYTHIEEVSDDGMPGVDIHSFKDTKQPGTILTFPVELFTKKRMVADKKETGLLKKILNKSPPDCRDVTTSYFRFRVKLNRRENSISTLFKPRASSITSQFEETQIIDFRVNEARILPLKIREQIQEASRLTKIHFFLIREASAEYKAAHSEFKRCRILESEIWDKYLGQKNEIDNQHMLIYHWTSSGKNGGVIDHFSAFSKFSSTTVTDKKIIYMIVFLITLGVISGIIANKIWSVMSTTQVEPTTLCVAKECITTKQHYSWQYFPVYGKYDSGGAKCSPSKGESDG